MLHTDDLRSLISDLGDALAQDPLPQTVEQTPEYKEFYTACSAGTPLLIDCPASGTLEGWTLQRLSALFGDSACTLEDCETGQKHASTIQHFISSLLLPEEAGKPPLKLKDYPPQATFASAFPTLCRSFQFALPCPAVTSFEGPANITNYFPSNYLITPDLGPKAYIATANNTDPSTNHGTTRLHMDLCDAINIMLPLRADSAAVWHIFAASDADKLRKFLAKKYPDEQINHIHAQHTYLAPDDLKDLAQKYDVHPYVFTQRGNQAVLIPTGCAHQVLNLSPCAKIAVDFLSHHSIARCGDISEQLRMMDQDFPPEERRPDVLEFKNLLLHAWIGLSRLHCILDPVHIDGGSSPLTPSPESPLYAQPFDSSWITKNPPHCDGGA
ncbi:hypothetical protein PTI98_009474 [Pleurotus ostreatus]|nr:hypothetical protein PTI98_009474 [Pleurotus ostreatus]